MPYSRSLSGLHDLIGSWKEFLTCRPNTIEHNTKSGHTINLVPADLKLADRRSQNSPHQGASGNFRYLELPGLKSWRFATGLHPRLPFCDWLDHRLCGNDWCQSIGKRKEKVNPPTLKKKSALLCSTLNFKIYINKTAVFLKQQWWNWLQ